jgi:hypothetical protein
MRAANALELIVLVEPRDLGNELFGLAAFLQEQHG